MSRILSQSSLRRQMSEVDKGQSFTVILSNFSFLVKGVTVDSRLPVSNDPLSNDGQTDSKQIMTVIDPNKGISPYSSQNSEILQIKECKKFPYFTT